MASAVFLYGPMCHAPLREEILGSGHSVVEARLAGFRRIGTSKGLRPALVPEKGGEVSGLLVQGLDDEARARADFFAATAGCKALSVKARTGRVGSVAARAYTPDLLDGSHRIDKTSWDFAQWRDTEGEAWVMAAREAMVGVGRVPPKDMARRWPTMCLRAATKVRAAEGAGTEVRADLTAERDVEILRPRRPYTEYFSLEDPDLRFRRFNGDWSEPVRRAAFVGGDAVTVLPYDPVLDSVLVVEQFRTGPLMRGDPRPWTLEPIAGRIDPGEGAEQAGRREAEEEAKLSLVAMHRIADYYPTPGAVTEFLYSYVAEADLAGQGGVIGGEAAEAEDIRTHVVPFERMMDLVSSGEAGTGPLILSVYWLALNRLRLWG